MYVRLASYNDTLSDETPGGSIVYGLDLTASGKGFMTVNKFYYDLTKKVSIGVGNSRVLIESTDSQLWIDLG